MRIIDIMALYRSPKNTTRLIVRLLGHYIYVRIHVERIFSSILQTNQRYIKNRIQRNPTHLTCSGALATMEASFV